jgi:hypothetical protein
MHAQARRWTLATLLSALALSAACSGSDNPTDPGTTTPPPPAGVRLKEVLIDRLPSPFYHFDYDGTGRVAGASYASGLDNYQVEYLGDRIRQIKNVGVSSLDHIVYAYDDKGRVGGVRYVDATGSTFTIVVYTYDINGKLTDIERSQRVTGGFIIDKTTTLAYYADGNLATITEHRPTIDSVQTEATDVTRFEEYDTGTNVDGFSLIHDDFFDHLVLLPGVVIQKNNPKRETRTGDGLTYSVEYTYTYDTDGKRPLTKRGDLVITGGGTVGLHVPTSSVFTYY